MKFNIEVDLDWLSEDGSIEEAIKEEIVEKTVFEVSKRMGEYLNNEINLSLRSKIDSQLNNILNTWMNKEIELTNRWGEIEAKGRIIDILKSRFDDFWNEKVDKSGRNAKYANETRIEQFLRVYVDHQCEFFANKMAKEVEKQVKLVMSDKLKLALGDEIVRKIGVPQLIERITNTKALP